MDTLHPSGATHLGNIQRRSHRSSYRPRNSSSHNMRPRTVAPIGIDHAFEAFVHGKLDGGKGDRHGQGGRVRDVECSEAFGGVDGLGAGEDGAVGRVLELHALFDHCARERQRPSEQLTSPQFLEAGMTE